MSIDDELRSALHDRAGRIEPRAGSWDRVQERLAAEHRRRPARSGQMLAFATAAAVALAAGTVALLGGDDGARVVETGPAAPPATDLGLRSPTVPPPSSDERAPTNVPGIWPLHTVAEREAYEESGQTHWDDPVEVARAFAVEYLGMVDPVVAQPTGPGPDGTLDVVVQARGEGGQRLPAGILETVVKLDRDGAPWQVLSTTSSNLRIDGGAFRNGVASPLLVSGQGRAFEGTIDVEVRQAGMEAGEALGRTFITAGAGATFGDFSTEVSFAAPTTEGFGALIVFTQSAVDGSTTEATVVGLSFGEGQPTTTSVRDSTEVTIFLLRGEETVPVARVVPRTTGVLRAAIEQLVAGPSEGERADGLSSLFSTSTAGALGEVTIDGSGRATVDFGSKVVAGNASTSTGSGLLLAQLNATVFQFPNVTSVEYRVDGSCETFYLRIERVCEVVHRSGR